MAATLPGTYLLLPGHTIRRMLERNISLAEVRHAITDAEQSYPNPPGYDEERITYQRGDIAVVVAPQRRTVVTVLFRVAQEWSSTEGRPSGVTLLDGERTELIDLIERSEAEQARRHAA